ncbi:MAG: DUF2061 domain-containing protein [Deltaproteobacteria bacterium]|nr:DUF2061 domain-containing protein [Deltaproteobacteria bacterium]
MREHMKLIMKTIIYRFYSVVIAFFVFYALTGKLKLASEFTVTVELIKIVQYYVFELFWKKRKIVKSIGVKSNQSQAITNHNLST